MNSFQSASLGQSKALGNSHILGPFSPSLSLSLTCLLLSLSPPILVGQCPSTQQIEDKTAAHLGTGCFLDVMRSPSSPLRLGELWKGQRFHMGPNRQEGAQKLLKISRFRFQSICGARLLTRVARAFSLASAAVGLRWRPLSWNGSLFQVPPSWGHKAGKVPEISSRPGPQTGTFPRSLYQRPPGDQDSECRRASCKWWPHCPGCNLHRHLPSRPLAHPCLNTAELPQCPCLSPVGHFGMNTLSHH